MSPSCGKVWPISVKKILFLEHNWTHSIELDYEVVHSGFGLSALIFVSVQGSALYTLFAKIYTSVVLLKSAIPGLFFFIFHTVDNR